MQDKQILREASELRKAKLREKQRQPGERGKQEGQHRRQ
jgi:hypothetical protein